MTNLPSITIPELDVCGSEDALIFSLYRNWTDLCTRRAKLLRDNKFNDELYSMKIHNEIRATENVLLKTQAKTLIGLSIKGHISLYAIDQVSFHLSLVNDLEDIAGNKL